MQCSMSSLIECRSGLESEVEGLFDVQKVFRFYYYIFSIFEIVVYHCIDYVDYMDCIACACSQSIPFSAWMSI